MQTFTALGAEPWLCYGTGVLELLGGVALGAIGSHIAVLGFAFPFPPAVLLLVLAAVIIWLTQGRATMAKVKA